MRRFTFNARVTAIASLIGVFLFWLILLVAQSLNRGYNPIEQSLSDLAIGSYRWLATIDFFLLAGIAISLGFGVFYGMPHKRGLRAASILFFVMAFGEIISGLFHVSLVKTPLSLTALIHQVGATIAAIAFPAATFVLVTILRSDIHWQGLANYTLGVAVSMFILEVAREALLATTWLNPWFGLYEKILLANSHLWIILISLRLIRGTKRAQTEVKGLI